MKRSRSRRLFAVLSLVSVLGCSSATQRNDWSTYTGPGREHFQREEITLPLAPVPLEPVNRFAWSAGDLFLLGIVSPAGRVWRFLVPAGVRTGMENAVENLGYPVRWVNNVLQGKFEQAGNETDRFLLNSTVGGLGAVDVAAERGIDPSPENLGRTLESRGWTDDPVVTLPAVGPTSTRDAVGRLGDAALDPATYFLPVLAIKSFINGTGRVSEYERFKQTHLDPHASAKFIWSAHRSVADIDFSNTNSEPNTDDELRAMSFSFEEPWVPSRTKSHTVKISTSGRHLRYELWLQPDPAPVVFILPGLGAHRLAKSSVAAAEMFFRRGFSAVTISSAMHSDFMETASTVAVPGFVPVDARDVHVALDTVYHDLERRYPARMTGRALMGMSLGAFHALHIAAAEGDPGNTMIGFDRYIVVNPPLQMSHCVSQFDSFYNAPLALPPEKRDQFILGALKKVVRLDIETDAARREEISFSRIEVQFLIGLNFRLALHDVIWSSQSRHDMGVLKTPLNDWRRAPATDEILDFSFAEYFYAFVLPYYMERNSEITSGEEMFELMDVYALVDRFPPAGKVRVFANRNDFLLTAEHIEWLTSVFGERNVFFRPKGGYMGSLFDPAVRERIVDSLDDLLAPGVRTNASAGQGRSASAKPQVIGHESKPDS